jgi:hypothetical protein
MTAPPDFAKVTAESERLLRCLYLAMPEEVARDVEIRVNDLISAAHEAGRASEREELRAAAWDESNALDMIKAVTFRNMVDNACDAVDAARANKGADRG